MITKVCPGCQQEKPLTDEFFARDSYVSKKTGERKFERRCRKCRVKGALKSRANAMADPAKKEVILKKRKAWSVKHYAEHHDEYVARRIKNAPKYNQERREKRARGEFRELDKIRYQKRYSDPKYRINKMMSNKINSLLKKNGESWLKYVPYSLNDLIEHLSKQFDSNMTLENHGSYWHIDHIRPIHSFKNITSFDCPEFQECWSLANLRPLEAKANIIKGHKWTP